MNKWPLRVVLVFAVLFVVAQLVPYGRAHTNPPVVAEPVWSSAGVRALAVRACFDCHSNETHWPWYANVAPVSWLVQRDVDEGRSVVNYSEWQRPQEAAFESAEELAEGEMPPRIYRFTHPEAVLTDSERRMLIGGFEATMGGSAAARNAGGVGEDDDD